MKKYRINYLVSAISIVVLLISCSSGADKEPTIETDENGYAVLTDEQVENIVKRSYQYVAMYNVNNKFAIQQGGWNTVQADTKLKDHTLTDIARPNNDSFYTGVMLDLRNGPIILDLPVFDSKYVSLMVTAYDHYVHVPKATRLGDFKKYEKILFYTQRTKGYSGEGVEGVDAIFEANGDFISAVFRVMPHVNEPDKFKNIVTQIGKVKIQTLSEFQGKEAIQTDKINFPKVGKTDADVFENNLLEVMQFIFNHVSFNSNDDMDNKVLEAYKPLGIIPGKQYEAETAVKIDGLRFRKVAEELQKKNLSLLADPNMAKELSPRIFKPKGQTDLDAIVAVSVIGPIGLPMEEAMYPNVTTIDGEPMNAMYDYIIKMTKEQLPPAKAFWSLTLYDKANGFFIPNDSKKYSVGENSGMKLSADGGIDIYVAAEKPEGVPSENWLPINRKDEDIDIILRIYVPDLEKVETWEAPKAMKL